MKIIQPLLIAAALYALLIAGEALAGPPRPPGVPKEAVWAGGAEGAAWVRCDRISKEPWGPVFQCMIFTHPGGFVWARGLYVVATKSNGHFQRAQRFEGPPRYAYFDGLFLGLLGDKYAMVPHGVIDYPFPNGGGKRVTFDHGLQLGSEQQY